MLDLHKITSATSSKALRDTLDEFLDKYPVDMEVETSHLPRLILEAPRHVAPMFVAAQGFWGILQALPSIQHDPHDVLNLSPRSVYQNDAPHPDLMDVVFEYYRGCLAYEALVRIASPPALPYDLARYVALGVRARLRLMVSLGAILPEGVDVGEPLDIDALYDEMAETYRVWGEEARAFRTEKIMVWLPESDKVTPAVPIPSTFSPEKQARFHELIGKLREERLARAKGQTSSDNSAELPDDELDLSQPGLKRVIRPNKGSERLSLRVIREGMGIPLDSMADRVGLTEEGVSQVERLSLRVLHGYAKALGARCEVSFVFDDGRKVPVAED